MQAMLSAILDEVRPLIGLGKVADYIPALADVPANQLGIAVYGNDGSAYCAGIDEGVTGSPAFEFQLHHGVERLPRRLVAQALELLSERIGWSVF
jgi:hypothetical protein